MNNIVDRRTSKSLNEVAYNEDHIQRIIVTITYLGVETCGWKKLGEGVTDRNDESVLYLYEVLARGQFGKSARVVIVI